MERSKGINKMINITELETTATCRRPIGISEFDLKSSLGAMSVLDEYDSLEVYYSTLAGYELDYIAGAPNAYADSDLCQWT